MREYLSESNLLKAAILGAAMTLLSLPRLIAAEVYLAIYIPSAFFSMVLVSGAATAWSNKGGMCGLFPVADEETRPLRKIRRMLIGIAAGLVLALLLVPVYVNWIDPILVNAMTAAGDMKMLRMHYPPTLSGRIAAVLWVASFETMFFQASAMSLFSRLTGHEFIALAVTVCLRVFMSASQISDLNLQSGTFPVLFSVGVVSSISCLLFARSGLLGAAIFSATLCLHVFFQPLG